MNPVQNIRKNVFQMKQAELAEKLGVAQSSVARWESAGRFPDEHQSTVRELGRAICAESGKEWSDSWFFDAPAEPEQDAA